MLKGALTRKKGLQHELKSQTKHCVLSDLSPEIHVYSLRTGYFVFKKCLTLLKLLFSKILSGI